MSSYAKIYNLCQKNNRNKLLPYACTICYDCFHIETLKKGIFMKKINIKLFGLLFMLALGNSAYLISSQLLHNNESDEEAEYSFISPNEYSMHDLDASSLIDPLDSDDDDDEYIVYEFSQDNTDTFVVTEVTTVDEMPQPMVMVTEIVEPDFTGSEHERKHDAHELIHEARQELHDAQDLLNTTEHELRQLEHIQDAHHVNVRKERHQQDLVERNIATAQSTVATATRQVQRLAHSSDRIIQKEFETARNKLTRQLNETKNQ